MYLRAALGAFVLVAPAWGAPTLVPITKHAGSVKSSSYIVFVLSRLLCVFITDSLIPPSTFQDAASKDAFLKTGPTFAQSGSSVTYNYEIIPATAMVLNSPEDLRLVQGFVGVKSIEPDSIASIHYEVGLDGVEVLDHQPSAPSPEQLEKRWDNGLALTFDPQGIYVEHSCFGGRAKWGATFGGYADKDGNGHGTHTAGTAICSDFEPGVAGKAEMLAVKVLSDAGSGAISDVIAGIDWSAKHFQSSASKLAIATMSLGGLPNDAVDKAVQSAIDMGLHFTIAAGNSNADASTSSPARVQSANTIGAVDSKKQKASFSNYGALIDVWYYGVDVVSAWIDGPDSNKTLSGTSMATPGVAALLASALGNYGQMTPEDLSNKLKEQAVDEVTFAPVDAPAMVVSTHKLAQPW
ncbi:subtilisin-like serine protease [Ceratobasidium sp. UAMH 11750]|nr:subtilisin-like serine protease [Ceratobasidium sp. UAMH 11750]